jgi:hypothetical protein
MCNKEVDHICVIWLAGEAENETGGPKVGGGSGQHPMEIYRTDNVLGA